MTHTSMKATLIEKMEVSIELDKPFRSGISILTVELWKDKDGWHTQGGEVLEG